MDELTSLAVEARGGDRLAFGHLVRSAQAEVWRFCAHQVALEEADDLTQEVFVRAWRSIEAFRADASARTWLLAIAWRVCSEARRTRRRRRVASHRAAELRSVPGGAGEPGSGIAMLDLLESLRHERRAALVMTQLLGLSYSETAEALGCPVGTVRSRVARARGDLIELLSESERPGSGESAPTGPV